MAFKINGWLVALIIVAIILLIALFKGCKQSKIEVAAKEQAQHLADSTLSVLKESKQVWDSTYQDYQYSLDQAQAEKEFAVAAKEQTEGELDKALKENKDLIAKHKLGEYSDTNSTLVPAEYISDCESCFTKLDNTTKLTLRYKDDLNNLQNNWDKQNQIYQKRFKQLDEERLGFYNKINSLAKEAKTASDKLQPHGRLYLSWAVVCGPWPKMTGAGLMYQTKYNLIYEANWLYGSTGHMVYGSIKFPLSIRFK